MGISLRNRATAFGSFALVLLTLSIPRAWAGNGCGLIDEPCCGDNICTEGTCIGCAGETLESGGGAGPGCVPTCASCGTPGLGCCLGEFCQRGYTCLPATLPCETAQGEVSGQGSGAACETLASGGAAQLETDCFPCGSAGQRCCPDNQCGPDSICDAPQYEVLGGGAQTYEPPVCIPCGGPGEPCCEKGDCQEGFVCGPFVACAETTGDGGGAGFDCEQVGDSGAGGGEGTMYPGPVCEPCGGLDQLCCDGDQCNGENLLCGGEVCEACGAVDQQCCAGNTCPNANALCQEGICEALPAAPVMGWGALLALIGVLTGIGSVRLRRL